MSIGTCPSLRYGAIILAVCAILLAPRVFVQLYADHERENVIQSFTASSTDDAAIEEFARWAAGYWKLGEKKDVWNHLRRLPWPFRPDKDPISFLSGGGYCTEFIAAARWILGDRYELARHDLLFPDSGHSAISLKLKDGRWVFIDPFFGIAFKAGERLLSLQSLRARMAEGHELGRYAIALNHAPRQDLYRKLPQTFDGLAGTDVDVWIDLPAKSTKSWSLGTQNGDWRDTQTAGMAAEMTSHFFYIGRRFPANFRFHYRLPDDGKSYELRFHLVQPVDTQTLPAFSVRPVIEGHTLRFRLGPDDRTLTADASTLGDYKWQAIDWFEVEAMNRDRGRTQG